MYGDESGQDQSIESTRTKITSQQKTKYVMHMLILVAVHIFIFWYIPIDGNFKLYGTSKCNEEQEKNYGCKNFHKNGYLKVFYAIVCVYLLLSSL
jgi:hypothetical protein